MLDCDISDAACLERVFQHYSFSAVIHLASVLNTASRRDPRRATHVNIVGSVNLLEVSRKFAVPRVVYGSSLSVYGLASEFNGGEGVSEGDRAAPEEVYGASKRYVELAGQAYEQQFGLEFVSLRMSNVVGPGAVNTASPWRSDLFEKPGTGRKAEIAVPFSKAEALPLVHVTDVAVMLARLAEAQRLSFRVYNAPSETWKLSELEEYVASLDENVCFTFGSRRRKGPERVKAKRLRQEFGYEPVPIRERLQFPPVRRLSKPAVRPRK